MILVGAVLMSLRPHQIGTHDRLTAAKEALARASPRPQRRLFLRNPVIASPRW
jgi:hypothetical protein